MKSSELIRLAVKALYTEEARKDLKLHNAGKVELLITGVDSNKTTLCRSPKSLPGACYRHAGWKEMKKKSPKADIWLEYPYTNPWEDWESNQLTLEFEPEFS